MPEFNPLLGDPPSNQADIVSYLDREVRQLGLPNQDATQLKYEKETLHYNLEVLQAEGFPTSVQNKVYKDLMAKDPRAEQTLKQYFPDFQITGTGDSRVMHVQGTNPPPDYGADTVPRDRT